MAANGFFKFSSEGLAGKVKLSLLSELPTEHPDYVEDAPVPGSNFGFSIDGQFDLIINTTTKRVDIEIPRRLKLDTIQRMFNIPSENIDYRDGVLLDDGLITFRSQINQVDAEIALTRQQLDSITLTAPFDGVVIEGDLSQMLGSPVERGDALFKIAPLEGYRIILKVDESEISYVSQGQPGTLTLSSLSNRNLPLQVEQITSVARAEDGANIFRVEASLANAPELLRPGMEGIGKIDAGRERLVWIWSHEIIDWVRPWVWTWWA